MRVGLILFGLILGVWGCSESGEDTKTGSARIAMNGHSSLLIGEPGDPQKKEKPLVLGVKIIAVYLSEGSDDKGNNTGKTGIIYLNPECNEDIRNCDIGGAQNNVTKFFDIARDPAAVNADINASAREIEVGEYYYTRIELCKTASADALNLKFQTSGMTGPTEVLRTACVASGAKSATAISVTEGATVTVDLGYDYSDAAWIFAAGDTSTSGALDCVMVGDHKECIKLPTFTPSASVN